MSSTTTPIRIDLKKDEKLEIHSQDGLISTYAVDYLRSMCPCAVCREVRKGTPASGAGPGKKTLLTVLPGNYNKSLHARSAELVGNYALRIDWSDEHGSGIYSFRYLRDISPPPAAGKA